ncbi:FHA domain-containing protein [Cnuibacter sp. UC19_7]|uniref:FHA domain-containing protein n=1 Tax=Cnuibacter sp. UC19_7 TaxID=3350166 RepID=UPI00366B474F
MAELRCLSAEAGYTVIAALPAVVLLPAEAEGSVVDAVWRACTAADTTLERVVSSIPMRGGVESFLVLWLPETSTHRAEASDGRTGSARVIAVARGSAAADIRSPGGARRFGSAGALPWRMAEFDDVDSIVAGRLPPLPESHPVVPLLAHPVGRVVVSASTVYWTADSQPEPAGGLDDETVITRTRPRPETAVVETVLTEGPLERPVRFRVTLPDGERELDRPLVVGRRPRPRPGSDPASPGTVELVAVPSPSGVVSSSHVEIARAGSTAVVTDLRSTNGTTVTLGDGTRVRLRQGDSVAVAASASVDIGDGVILRITPIDEASPGHTPPDPPTASREFTR